MTAPWDGSFARGCRMVLCSHEHCYAADGANVLHLPQISPTMPIGAISPGTETCLVSNSRIVRLLP
jgi:hypothetical protein